MTKNAHRQPPDKLRFQSVINKISRGYLGKDFTVSRRFCCSAETNTPQSQSPLDLLLKAVKSSAADKQNMPGINDFPLCLTLALKFERRLKLGLNIHWVPQRNLRLLHQLQKRGLDAPPAHITARNIQTCSNLIDLVDVDDSVLSGFDISIRFLDESAHKVLHIAAHIAGFTEFRCVRFNERNADQIGNVFDEICFSHAGRAQQ